MDIKKLNYLRSLSSDMSFTFDVLMCPNEKVKHKNPCVELVWIELKSEIKDSHPYLLPFVNDLEIITSFINSIKTQFNYAVSDANFISNIKDEVEIDLWYQNSISFLERSLGESNPQHENFIKLIDNSIEDIINKILINRINEVNYEFKKSLTSSIDKLNNRLNELNIYEDNRSNKGFRIHFFRVILKILNNQKEILIDKFNEDNTIDNRIITLTKVRIIENYFKRLSDTKGDINKDEPILCKEDIQHFLCANFREFENRESKKHLKLNLKNSKVIIKKFIHTFYNTIVVANTRSEISKYHQLVIDNFECHKNSNLSRVASNFAKEPKCYPEYLKN